jgi:neutral ceramidase
MQTASWKAAAASVVITPTESMWLAGWAVRREPATGKAGELFCKALALEDANGKRIVMVTLDLIAVPRDFAQAVAARITEQWNLPRERILFNSSHTHNGPEIRFDKVPFFDIPPEYAAKIASYRLQLQQRVLTAVNDALSNLKPATLNVLQSRAEFARNRRDENGPSDHDVPILEVTGTDGKPLAVLFGCACHNLTLPHTVCLYHGDYAGIAQQELESHFPGVTAMFFAGAGADQDPFPRGTLELTAQHGRTLAENVWKALSGPKRCVTGSLSAAFEEVPLKFVSLPSAETLAADAASNDLPRRRKAEYLLSALKEKRPLPAKYPCPVQVVRFGAELLFIALGGEPVAEFAVKLKTEFAGSVVWVAGYSNDMFGYLPTRRVLAEGGYEGLRAWYWSALPGPFTDDAEETVLQTVRRLVKQTMTD